jgi:DNA-binding MarR family transcriptional regulator
MINDWVDFNTLKKNLNITDGNLANHIRALEEAGYLEVKKQFLKKRKAQHKL